MQKLVVGAGMADEDTRVTCTACNNLQRGHCVNPGPAGLHAHYGSKAELARTFSELPQRCNGYTPSVRVKAQS